MTSVLYKELNNIENSIKHIRDNVNKIKEDTKAKINSTTNSRDRNIIFQEYKKNMAKLKSDPAVKKQYVDLVKRRSALKKKIKLSEEKLEKVSDALNRENILDKMIDDYKTPSESKSNLLKSIANDYKTTSDSNIYEGNSNSSIDSIKGRIKRLESHGNHDFSEIFQKLEHIESNMESIANPNSTINDNIIGKLVSRLNAIESKILSNENNVPKNIQSTSTGHSKEMRTSELFNLEQDIAKTENTEQIASKLNNLLGNILNEQESVKTISELEDEINTLNETTEMGCNMDAGESVDCTDGSRFRTCCDDEVVNNLVENGGCELPEPPISSLNDDIQLNLTELDYCALKKFWLAIKELEEILKP